MALHGMIEWILALLGITVLAHLLIHIGLRAPRIRETGTPACQGLPFRRVVIRTVRGKRLFGWFIAANGHVPAPTVAVLHGWGGNAEMMLPLAGLCTGRATAFCFSMHAVMGVATATPLPHCRVSLRILTMS